MPSNAAKPMPPLTVACPKCGTPVPLTEALAAPLIEATRAEYESKLRAQNKALARREEEIEQGRLTAAKTAEQLKKREAELKTKQAQLAAEVARQTEVAVEEELAKRIAVEKKTIAKEEERRVALRFADELAQRDRDSKEQTDRIEQLMAKLTTAQKAELI